MMKPKKLYMLVTKDDLELPLIVEEDPKALAAKIGMTYKSFLSSISKNHKGYKRIILDDEDG